MRITNEMQTAHSINQEQKEEAIQAAKEKEIKSGDISVHKGEINVPKSILDSLPPELKEEIIELYEKGHKIDKETLQALKVFLNKSIGSHEEKVETIKALMGKGLDINLNNLKAVYEAMYGKELSQSMAELGITLSGDKAIDDISALIMQISAMRDKSAPLDSIADFIEDSIAGWEISIKGDIVKALNETRQAVNYRMMDIAERALDKGIRELHKAAVDKIPVNIEKDKKNEKSENNEVKAFDLTDKTESYVESALASLAISGKDYIVTEISQRLNKAAADFKELKIETAKDLDMVQRYIKGENKSEITSAHSILEKTIDNLDKVILKSDITLFTDMKTEKELIKSSSDLTKAKEYLEKGDYDKALKLTEKVKSLLENINWKPSNTRIIHYASTKLAFEAPTDKERLAEVIENYKEGASQGKESGRMVYEALRLLGADHEGEAARHLAESNGKGNPEENIKSILLKMMENPSHKDGAISQMADKLTGQQLMSKSDEGRFQTMLFNLPMVIGGRMKDAKLYINSKKEKEKLDWENCSIFFLIETDKLGETGIHLISSGRSLTVNLKNDNEGFENKVKPLLKDFKENLGELGYEIGSIVFSKLNSEKGPESGQPKEKTVKMRKINNPMKGFDIKI